MLTAVAVVLGFLLDLVIGDPRPIPHPIVLIGRAIEVSERTLRRIFPDTPRGKRWAGRVMAVLMPVAAFALTWGVIALLSLAHPVLGFLAEVWLSCQILATCELRRQSMRVVRALKEEGLAAGRRAVSMIVGRDTASLDETGVTKAAVETVAENASDGVVAPLFFLMIGGAPLGMAYKAVNTMDSMVGYKNDRYLDFGRAAAKLDDVVNFIPARLSALLMIAACPACRLPAGRAWAIWRRDHAKHASPNSAQTESVMAGALGVELAGDAVYFGTRVAKPTIGDAIRSVEVADIARANRLMITTACLACAVFALIRVGVFAALSLA